MQPERASSEPKTDVSTDDPSEDPFSQIDEILDERKERLLEASDRSAAEDSRRLEFLDSFAKLCDHVVRPAMEAVLVRLRRDGGGGLIEEHPGGEPRYRMPQLTLWMSLEGDVAGHGREDRYPYLRLDADATKRKVQVAEGDMWQGGGTHSSGRIGSWQLSEITADLVEHTIVDILRRSAT